MDSKKQILITGVCGAFGSKLATHFLSNNYKVLGLDISNEIPNELSSNSDFSHKVCNLAKHEEVTAVIDTYCQENGPFDVILNNVGMIFNEPLISFVEGEMKCHSFEKWNEVLSVSLSSAFYTTAIGAKYMAQKRKKGVIINISSICANGNPGQSAYSAAKAGMNGLTKTLAKELGPLGIRVVSIAPGFFDTPSTRDAVDEDKLKRLRKSVPLRKLGKVEQLAHAIDFVIGNPYYSGTILELDGGLTL